MSLSLNIISNDLEQNILDGGKTKSQRLSNFYGERETKLQRDNLQEASLV